MRVPRVFLYSQHEHVVISQELSGACRGSMQLPVPSGLRCAMTHMALLVRAPAPSGSSGLLCCAQASVKLDEPMEPAMAMENPLRMLKAEANGLLPPGQLTGQPMPGQLPPGTSFSAAMATPAAGGQPV